jgi:hypothetical protein
VRVRAPLCAVFIIDSDKEQFVEYDKEQHLQACNLTHCGNTRQLVAIPTR